MPWRNPIVAGQELVLNAIQSPDYIPGVSGWIIRRDGSAEFNNVTVRGQIVSIGDRVIMTSDSGGLLWETVSGITPVLAPEPRVLVSTPSDGVQTIAPSMQMVGPSYGGTDNPSIVMRGRSADGTTQHSRITITAEDVFIGSGVGNVTIQDSLTVTDDVIINGDLDVNGTLDLPTNEVYGSTVVNAGGAVVVGNNVTWAALDGAGSIRAFVTCNSGSANLKNASVTNLSATGGTINVLRDGANTNTTTYYHVRREL